MANVFLDCGFYRGKALEIYREKGLVDDSWAVYAFEASPEIDVPGFVIKKAVWIEDDKVTFQVGGRDDASSIKGTSGHGEPRLFQVPSIDFSRFVDELPDVYTVCSMDIEGAEFKVLGKMLAEGTLDKIDLLDVEFHHRLMEDKTQEDAQKLIEQIITKTAVRLKVALN